MSTNFGDAKRTLSTGDLVISVSEIFDRLQTKVDPNTLEQLLRDILAGRRDQVRPGELITAELINQILAELESLQVRVTKLEAGVVVTTPAPVATPIDITDLLPHGTVRVGEELTIVGKNFLVPAQNNQVSVGSVKVALFKTVSAVEADKKIIFDIPEVNDVSEGGTSVPVTVQNSNGSDTQSLVLRPRLTFPAGTLILKYTAAPVLQVGTNIEAAKPYDFIFTLTAKVNKEANYTVARVITPAGWTALLLNVDNDQPLSQLTIPANPNPGEQRQMRVRLTPATPSAGATTGTLALSVTENSGGNQVTAGNEQISITIGQQPPKPQTRVSMNFRGPQSGVVQVGNKLQYTRNVIGVATFDVFATEGGRYRVTAALRNPTGWTLAEPTAALPFERVFGTGGSTTPQPFPLSVRPDAGGTNTDVIFTIERVDGGTAFSPIERVDGGTAFSTQFVQPVSIV